MTEEDMVDGEPAVPGRRPASALAQQRAAIRGLGATIAFVLAVDIGVLVGGHGTPRERAQPTTTTTMAVATTTTLPAPTIDLAAAVAPSPQGFEAISDTAALAGGLPAGRVTIEQLAADRDEPTKAKAAFERHRLEQAFVRTWQRPGTNELVALRLYEFAGAEGAAGYLEETITATVGRAPGAARLAIAGTDGAVSVTGGPLDRQGRALLYLFGRRARVVVVLAAAVAPPGDMNLLTSALRTQLDLLVPAPTPASGPTPPPATTPPTAPG